MPFKFPWSKARDIELPSEGRRDPRLPKPPTGKLNEIKAGVKVLQDKGLVDGWVFNELMGKMRKGEDSR